MLKLAEKQFSVFGESGLRAYQDESQSLGPRNYETY
jgi:hypothetical protein